MVSMYVEYGSAMLLCAETLIILLVLHHNLNQVCISSFHIILSNRCAAMPLGMPYYGDRNICTNYRVMAYAPDLDILLHFQVQCVSSAVSLLASSLIRV